MAWDRFGRRPKEDPVHGYVWGGGGGPHGSYMTNRDITGGDLVGYDMYDQPMTIGRGISPSALARGYVDVSDRPRDMDPGMGVWPVTPGFNRERILPEWLKRESKNLEEEENLAGGGIASTRPGYKWGGLPITNQGFDTSGGETWQQAKTVQMDDPGLWTRGKVYGSNPTDVQKDINQLWKDRKRYGQGYIDQAGIGLNTEEKFFNEYPNIPKTFKPFEDVEEQYEIGEFPKKAPPGYLDKWDLAGGGIASLENRPGYKWAGEVKGSDWQPGRGVDTDWKYRGRDPEGNIQATWRTNLSGPEGTGGISFEDFYRNQGKDYWDKHGYLTGSPRQRTKFTSGPMSSEFFNEMYPTYDDQIMRGQRVRDYQNKLGTAWPDQPYSGWKSKSPIPYEATRGTGYGDEEGEFYQGGGAVGLEPGIGSLMGYAKGGMVTRVRVPKGQSKWMKRFMNSMRDN